MRLIQPALRSVLVCLMLGATSVYVAAQGFPQLPDLTNRPPSTNIIDWPAIEAAQQAQFNEDFGPWLTPDDSSLYNDDDYSQYILASLLESGDPVFLTAEQKEAIRSANLQTLASANQSELDAQQAEAQDYAATNDIPMRIEDPDWGTAVLRRIEDGQPVYLITHDMPQAATMAVPAIWTNGATGLNLSGSGTFMAMFDGGKVLTNHQEFGTRVFNDIGVLELASHPTHVAGVLASAGVNTNSVGMSPRAILKAYDMNGDASAMATVASTNRSLVSNHSYGNAVGWEGLRWCNVTHLGTVIANGYYPVWNGDPAIDKTNDYNFGLYNKDATNMDAIVYKAGSYLPVFSAGNERGPHGLPSGVANGATYGFYCRAYNGAYGGFVASGDANFPAPPADGATAGWRTIPPYACAKNNLVVGSITNIAGGYQGSNGVKISGFSSLGPTSDGRIKPDLMAPGENILFPDTNSTTGYTTDSGTSFSAPAVAGALNLIIEQNTRQNGTNAQLLASTLRGLAIHTADAAGTNAGPSYRSGWGMFDAQKAATLFAANRLSNGLAFIKEIKLCDGDYIQFPVTVTNGTVELKVTICWTDPQGAAFPAALNPTNLALVNDLDLRVISPNSTTNFPWVLNPADPSAAATHGDNFRDNVEQVVIPTPTSGSYLVRVTHKGHIVNAARQNSAQSVSVITSGVQVQPRPAVQIVNSLAFSTNRLFALRWSSTAGLNYQILQCGGLSGTNLSAQSWQPANDLISAGKTNTAFLLQTSKTTNQFFRVVETRP